MRKLLLVSFIALNACVTLPPEGKYHPRTSVLLDHNRFYEGVNGKPIAVENKDLVIEATPDTADAGTSFVFKNKTNSPLQIVWDESNYIDPNGKAERIFHSGVKIIDRSQSQPPTNIPPQSSVSDDVIPIGNVTWASYGMWTYSPLCGTRDLEKFTISDDECVGKTFTYFFTYLLDGKKKNLTVKFKLARKEKVPPPPAASAPQT
jgi:hypothetical protein